MLTIQSPQNNQGITNNSFSSKLDLLSNVSPTFRNKRIPSAHDNYSYSSNHNLKIIKCESPPKASQKLKRRKSQYINTNSYSDNNQMIAQKKKSSKSIHNNANNVSSPVNLCISSSNKDLQNMGIYSGLSSQSILNEMNLLKNQYKQLKTAYKQLIEQKIKNAQKMSELKQEKRKLQSELQLLLTKHKNCGNNQFSISQDQAKLMQSQNQKLKQSNKFYERELERIKKECYKILQAEKFKIKKLQDTLKEKDVNMSQLRKQLYNKDPSNCLLHEIQTSKKIFSNDYIDLNLGNSLVNQNCLNKSVTQRKIYFQQVKNLDLTPKITNDLHSKFNNSTKNNPILNANNFKIQPDIDLKLNQLNSSHDSNVQNFINNQSQFVSISLTSVMQQSVYVRKSGDTDVNDQLNNLKIIQGKQPLRQAILNHGESSQTVLHRQNNINRQKLTGRGIQNTMNNDVNIQKCSDIQTVNHNQKGQKQGIKKMRKQVHQKLEINLNHFENKKQVFSIKTPLNSNGMGMKNLGNKNKNSKSKKKQEDKQNNWNGHNPKQIQGLKQNSEGNLLARNMKKKQKCTSQSFK